MPRSPRMTHVRFHEAHRQTRNCPTGGQRRPPLQDVLRFRRKYVQFCDCVLRGRGRTPPLRHVGQFYVFTSIAANPQLPHGRTEVSAPTGRFTVSPMVRAILRLHTAGESAASTPTNVVRIRIGAFVFAGTFRRADRGVRPYGCMRVRIGASRFAGAARTLFFTFPPSAIFPSARCGAWR